MSLRETYEPRIRQALEDIKEALARKEVVCDTLTASEVPDKIREIELNKYTLTLSCSEFTGGTVTATLGGTVRKATVVDGQAILKLNKPGTWRVEHDLGDYADIVVEDSVFQCSGTLQKKRVVFSEGDCSEEKIVVHIDSVTGNNSKENFIQVKKNGTTISAKAQLVGSDIEITEFEYEEGATYTIEYVLSEEVRGSIEVTISNIEDYIADTQKNLYDGIYKETWGKYEDYPTHIVFTDQKAPEDAQTHDWSANQSNGIVRWLDSETDTLYISSQKEGQKIILTYFGSSPFADTGGLGSPLNEKTETIDFYNLDTSQVTYMAELFRFCRSLKEIKNLQNLNTENVTTMKEMFHSCKVQELDLSSFNMKNVTDCQFMFANCSLLETIYAQEWDKMTFKDYSMFADCEKLPNYQSTKEGKEMAKWKENGGYFTNPSEKPS